MMKRSFMVSALATALSLPMGSTPAADQPPAHGEAQSQQQMQARPPTVRQARAEFRAKMRAAKTPEEREQIRKEYNESMKPHTKQPEATPPAAPPPPAGGGH